MRWLLTCVIINTVLSQGQSFCSSLHMTHYLKWACTEYIIKDQVTQWHSVTSTSNPWIHHEKEAKRRQQPGWGGEEGKDRDGKMDGRRTEKHCLQTVGQSKTDKENERERDREAVKLGQVTWLGSTAGGIKYPTACGHLHNKCRFHFMNYFSSTGDGARHRACDATHYWKASPFSEDKNRGVKDWSEPFPLRQETKREPEIAWKWS